MRNEILERIAGFSDKPALIKVMVDVEIKFNKLFAHLGSDKSGADFIEKKDFRFIYEDDRLWGRNAGFVESWGKFENSYKLMRVNHLEARHPNYFLFYKDGNEDESIAAANFVKKNGTLFGIEFINNLNYCYAESLGFHYSLIKAYGINEIFPLQSIVKRLIKMEEIAQNASAFFLLDEDKISLYPEKRKPAQYMGIINHSGNIYSKSYNEELFLEHSLREEQFEKPPLNSATHLFCGDFMNVGISVTSQSIGGGSRPYIGFEEELTDSLKMKIVESLDAERIPRLNNPY